MPKFNEARKSKFIPAQGIIREMQSTFTQVLKRASLVSAGVLLNESPTHEALMPSLNKITQIIPLSYDVIIFSTYSYARLKST